MGSDANMRSYPSTTSTAPPIVPVTETTSSASHTSTPFLFFSCISTFVVTLFSLQRMGRWIRRRPAMEHRCDVGGRKVLRTGMHRRGRADAVLENMRRMDVYVRSIDLGGYRLYERMMAGRVFAMLLRPRNPKYMKYFKIKLPANRPFTGLKWGTFGLVTREAGILKAEQIEAARMALTRTLKKKAKIWTIPHPNKSYTKKPAETRMGKGHWCCHISQESHLCDV